MFQFHYGMIGRLCGAAPKTYLQRFNSTMGWLEAQKAAKPWHWLWSFNSTMGWLEVLHVRKARCIKRVSIPLWDDWKNQSQKEIAERVGGFNSTMGWLEGSRELAKSVRSMSFNSTMGWLEDSGASLADTNFSLFQFHYGMIGSRKFIKKNNWFTACS